MKYKLTIITVCYNAEKEIEKTINSVLNQSYKRYEFIVVDGKSKDETLKKIENFHSFFLEKEIEYNWISERDEGIYDAMNKGIKLANGEWLLFLNAGDTFYDNEVLEKIFQDKIPKKIGLIYGDTNLIYEKKEKIKRHNGITKRYFLFNMINHQSAFIKREAINFFDGYNLKYKYCADKDLLMKILYKKKYKKKYKQLIVANYDMMGVSSKNFLKVWKENREISKIYHPKYLIIFKDILNSFRFIKKCFTKVIDNVFNNNSML